MLKANIHISGDQKRVYINVCTLHTHTVHITTKLHLYVSVNQITINYCPKNKAAQPYEYDEC